MCIQENFNVKTIIEQYKSIYDDKVPNLPLHKDLNLKISFSESQSKDQSITTATYPFANSDTHSAAITSFKTFCNLEDDQKAIYQISFDIKHSGFKFQPGDTIGVIPQNNEKEVDFILKHLDLIKYANKIYNLEPLNKEKKSPLPIFIPQEGSLRYVLTHCVEIRAVVKKLFLLALSRHTSDPDEKRCLEILCSKDAAEFYNKYILNKSTSILDILKMCPTCKPPITVLLSHLPRLLPRPYSVVNSQRYKQDTLSITFSVYKGAKKGLTSGFLEKIIHNKVSCDDLSDQLNNISINDDSVQIYLRKNLGFCLPSDLKKDMIMIGVGTGVAPFMGFLEERKYHKYENHEIGSAWLIFGCKSPRHCLYKDEIEMFCREKVLEKFITCYSASKEHTKTYVQDAVSENIEEILGMLDEGASLYVCGDLNKIANEIEIIITESYEKLRQASKERSREYLKKLKLNKQFIVDAWS